MTKSKQIIVLILIVAFAGAGLVMAQRYSRRRYDDRRGVPEWKPDKEFSHDVFTFARIRYSSGYGGRGYGDRGYGRSPGRRGGGYGRGFSGGNWATDYPDSDLNFSYRLHQLTSMEVDPQGVVLELTDPKLFDYPFIYIVEPGRLVFSED